MTDEHPVDPMQDVLSWLSSEPGDDLDAELSELSHCIGSVASATESMPVPQRQDVLSLLCQRANDVCGRFRPGLLACTLPVSNDLYAKTFSLIESLFGLSNQLRVLYDDIRHRKLRQGGVVELCGYTLGVLSETYLLSTLLGAAAPFGLWQRIHDAWISAGQYERLKDDSAESNPSKINLLYRRLLTMSVSRIESLTLREQQWLFDYMETIGDDLVLACVPLPPVTSSHWFDPNQDMSPVACVRRIPEKGVEAVYFSMEEIVHRIDVQILWLEKGLLDLDVSARKSGDTEILEVGSAILPLGLTPTEILSLLRRLREQWSAAPERAEARVRQHYMVQVCVGLRNVWAMGRNAPVASAEWTVYNESPGGYAILCVGGVHRSLSAGAILALRREASQEWTVCMVRWVRTDTPQQVELGLQTLGRGFTPVLVCFRGNDVLVPALMMERDKATQGHRIIVTEAGSYVSNQFVMVHEASGNLYLAQGTAFGLDMQTATIEIFQFEVDPYAK